MKQYKILSKTLIGLALAGSLNLAHAQVPVGDGAHIGLQAGQWAQNLVQWSNDANRWISGIKSQVRGKLNDLTANYGVKASESQADLSNIVAQLRASNKCESIELDASKQLCLQIKDLEVKKVQLYVDALNEADVNFKEVQAGVKIQQELAQAGKAVAAAASVLGLGGDTNKEGETETQEKNVELSYEKLQTALNTKKQEIEDVDNQIALLTKVRTEIARAQFEGKKPGVFEELVSKTAIVTTLTAAEGTYKTKINNIKSQSYSENRY